jgi:hypothetical protein
MIVLKNGLIALSRFARVGTPAHPGVLGRAAEYLVGKRGLVFLGTNPHAFGSPPLSQEGLVTHPLHTRPPLLR